MSLKPDSQKQNRGQDKPKNNDENNNKIKKTWIFYSS